jgi:RHS repeat-associated protein
LSFLAQRVAMKQGSTSVASDANGAQVSQQTYYAFGSVRTTSGTLPTDYTFTGQKNDSSDALLFYNARYYDAYLNRWTQPDSIIPDWYNPQSLNRFAYVYNNPIKYTDPTGHDVGCAGNDINTCAGDSDADRVYDDPVPQNLRGQSAYRWAVGGVDRDAIAAMGNPATADKYFGVAGARADSYEHQLGAYMAVREAGAYGNTTALHDVLTTVQNRKNIMIENKRNRKNNPDQNYIPVDGVITPGNLMAVGCGDGFCSQYNGIEHWIAGSANHGPTWSTSSAEYNKVRTEQLKTAVDAAKAVFGGTGSPSEKLGNHTNFQTGNGPRDCPGGCFNTNYGSKNVTQMTFWGPK